jgi:hypothetical protein
MIAAITFLLSGSGSPVRDDDQAWRGPLPAVTPAVIGRQPLIGKVGRREP